MVKIILGVAGLSFWLYVLVMRSIRLNSENVSRELHH